MFLDFFECVVQLLCILVALLISLFGYINTRKRRYLLSVGFFLANLLSSYFWTAHLIIMKESPEVSDILAYFGWNTAFFILMVLTFYVKSPEERGFFHPLMLVPIPLNIWQFTLYIQFGGIANSLYQVVVCTAIAVMCLQSLLWYMNKKESGTKAPLVIIGALAIVAAEFGMWTTSSLEGIVAQFYYSFSFICSGGYLFLVWGIGKSVTVEKKEEESHIDNRVQNILKISYVIIVFLTAIGGVLLGEWIKDVISLGMTSGSSKNVYEIIPVILFLTSIVIASFALGIILVVYFEKKMAENVRLRQQRILAEHSNAAKSDFLANMSHEIRTPINAVLGMNEMILRESARARKALPDDREEIRGLFSVITNYAGNIDSAGNNLLSLINDILDFSKIEAGKLELKEEEYKLESVLNDVCNMVIFKAREKGLKMEVEVDSDLPDCLFGDENRIRQIMINLLNNAVKYTNSGSVTLYVNAGDTIRYTAGENIDLIIKVKDTGIGIKEEDLEKIFAKFERTDLKVNSTVEGTGLGLAITHHLVDMMNGSIDVKSSYGKGSIFTVTIPQKVISTYPVGDFREKFETGMAKPKASDNGFIAPQASILIVDDTRMNLIVAAGLLRETEAKIQMSESGEDALRRTMFDSFDIIFLDQRMPGMDGIETLRQIKTQADGKNKDTPVICLTADAISGAKERYLSEGFTDYLSKPIDSKGLKDMVKKYLPKEKIKASYENENAPVYEDKSGEFEALKKGDIDPVKGLNFSKNDSEFYKMILAEYEASADKRKSAIEEAYGSKDWESYGTLVHSLKSSSRTIGAASLSTVAARLEEAADAGDAEAIEREHRDMMDRYEKTLDAVRSMDLSGSKADTDEEILEFMPK
ncbi:MAG: response regulator [Lachnospiraceae bacterium]|nr:response regulator [Lachnospiraceae bacterium]